MANKKHIVIIGGGFAGIKTLHALYKNPNLTITLINDEDTFRYGATIWRATTGYLKETSYLPIEDLIPQADNVTFIQDVAVKIDRQEQIVTTKSNKQYKYDYCVIGLGVVTSYFGIKGLEDYSYTIKSSKGFDAFRQHLHQAVTSQHALDKNYIVVGAGPTGVELAAALKTYLKEVAKHHKIRKNKVNVTLVEAAPRVLPTLSKKASRAALRRLRKLNVNVMTAKTVKSETKNTLSVDNMSIPTQTVLWTAGVTNNPFFNTNADQFDLNERKRVIVDSNLRVDQHTFVIGDSASTLYSGLALTALHNASYVSRVITRDIKGLQTPPYKPLKPVTIIPIGNNWSIFQWRSVIFSGRFASLLRTLYDFIGYSEIMGVRPAYRLWIKRNQRLESCPNCKEYSTINPKYTAK